MKIGVITYNVPHKKTQDVLFRLKAAGFTNVECIALPFIDRVNFKSLVSCRLGDGLDILPDVFCERLGYEYTENVDLGKYDKILIGGASILEPDFIKGYEIINAHPGYLPYVRGLDSLKWAILGGLPLGVTTHIIDEDIDLGFMIAQEFIGVDYFDTIHSLAYKLYVLELDMLLAAIDDPNRCLLVAKYPPNRRMPHVLELKMLAKLEQMRLK